MSPDEARDFIAVLKTIMARDSASKSTRVLCSQKSVKEYEKLFQHKIKCGGGGKIRKQTSVSLDIFVNKDNPVLAKEYCFSPRKVLIKTSSSQGRKVSFLYKSFLKNYETNIEKIQSLLGHLVIQNKVKYSLKEINKQQLDDIIHQVKQTIKLFFLQSFVDYQQMLDAAKLIPHIEFSTAL